LLSRTAVEVRLPLNHTCVPPLPEGSHGHPRRFGNAALRI
jgi:hypothetical protein